MEEQVLSFADDTNTHCKYSITDHTLDTENANYRHRGFVPKYPAIHSQRKHVYRDTFGDAHIQYHDFDNQDSLTLRDLIYHIVTTRITKPILEFT